MPIMHPNLLKLATTKPRKPSSKTLHNPQGVIWASDSCTSLGRHYNQRTMSSMLQPAMLMLGALSKGDSGPTGLGKARNHNSCICTTSHDVVSTLG